MGKETSIEKLKMEKEKWEREVVDKEIKIPGERKTTFQTASGIPVKKVYTPVDLEEKRFDYSRDLNFPGVFPYTRGITSKMYRSNLWVFGQYAGLGTAEETNRRYKYLISKGYTGLSVALDLPTQIGLDSDHYLAHGEVGKAGVAIDSLKDVDDLFDGIPLDKPRQVSTTANSIGPIWIALILSLGEKQGIPPEKYNLRLQNDSLKEYIARGTYIFPPRASLKFSCDVIEFFSKHHPAWFPISISGYHIREAGASAVQEVAFTMANAVAYIEETIRRDIPFSKFGPQLCVFLSSGMDLFEEIAKFRAMRRVWSRILKDRFKVEDLKSLALNLINFTTGSTLTAQQPYNNLVRVTIEALASVLGGCQTLFPSSMDEAFCTPTEKAVTLSLRTQQIIAYETNVTNTVDPLGGSYYLESLTSEIEESVMDYMKKIDSIGGSIAAIESGFFQKEISESAYKLQKEIETGEKAIVGLNKFVIDEDINLQIMRSDPRGEERQIEKLKGLQKTRDNRKVNASLSELKIQTKKNNNLVPAIIEAVKCYATVGEICDVLRGVYGEYHENLY
jgi:methylmalonyl-CoA mutase N-terminal domain/subunit